MPTYAYACTSCGEQLEVVQKFSDDPLTVCPTCEGRLRKLFSPVGVVFKGSGFYKTDSRSKSGSSAPATPKEGSSGGSGEKATGDGGSSTSGGSGDKPSSSGDKPAASGDKSSGGNASGGKVA